MDELMRTPVELWAQAALLRNHEEREAWVEQLTPEEQDVLLETSQRFAAMGEWVAEAMNEIVSPVLEAIAALMGEDNEPA